MNGTKVKLNIFGKEVKFEFFYQSGTRQPMKCIIKELQYTGNSSHLRSTGLRYTVHGLR